MLSIRESWHVRCFIGLEVFMNKLIFPILMFSVVTLSYADKGGPQSPPPPVVEEKTEAAKPEVKKAHTLQLDVDVLKVNRQIIKDNPVLVNKLRELDLIEAALKRAREVETRGATKMWSSRAGYGLAGSYVVIKGASGSWKKLMDFISSTDLLKGVKPANYEISGKGIVKAVVAGGVFVYLGFEEGEAIDEIWVAQSHIATLVTSLNAKRAEIQAEIAADRAAGL